MGMNNWEKKMIRSASISSDRLLMNTDCVVKCINVYIYWMELSNWCGWW